MAAALTHYYEAGIDELVASGVVANRSEAVRMGLRMLFEVHHAKSSYAEAEYGLTRKELKAVSVKAHEEITQAAAAGEVRPFRREDFLAEVRGLKDRPVPEASRPAARRR